MSNRSEVEPVIPRRNIVDSFFIETLRTPDVGYAVGPVLIAAVAAIGIGILGVTTEGLRAAAMIQEHSFVEAIRSGLTVMGAEVAVATGVGVIESFAHVSNHPNHIPLYEFHARKRTAWDKSVRELHQR